MDIVDQTPEMLSVADRVALTLRCRDCDDIPKVPDAGSVQDLPDGRQIQIMHNGLRVQAGGYYGAWMQTLIERARGHHEPQEERVFHEIINRLSPTATMIELGGYWLYYSLWFLKNSPERRSIAVEPEPRHIDVGKTNAALNDATVEIINAFVGVAPSDGASFRTEISGDLTIPWVSVPQIMSERGIQRLDLLHCDAQGAELSVLESCASLLREGRIEWVVVSTHAHQISGDPLMHQRCLALLRGVGATIIAEHDVHESFSGDGLIVARVGGYPSDWVPLRLSHNRYSESLYRNPLFDLAVTKQMLALEKEQNATLSVRVTEAERCLSAAEAARRIALDGKQEAEAIVMGMRTSTSWRVTEPFRRLRRLL